MHYSFLFALVSEKFRDDESFFVLFAMKTMLFHHSPQSLFHLLPSEHPHRETEIRGLRTAAQEYAQSHRDVTDPSAILTRLPLFPTASESMRMSDILKLFKPRIAIHCGIILREVLIEECVEHAIDRLRECRRYRTELPESLIIKERELCANIGKFRKSARIFLGMAFDVERTVGKVRISLHERREGGVIFFRPLLTSDEKLFGRKTGKNGIRDGVELLHVKKRTCKR